MDVDSISIRKRKVILLGGSAVPILRRRDKTPRIFSLTKDLRVPPPPAEDRVLRLSRTTLLPPESESWVDVFAERCGFQFLKTNDKPFDCEWVSLSPGIVEVQKNAPFKLKVAKFASKPRRLSRLQLLGYVMPAPEQSAFYAVNFEDDVASAGSNEKLEKSKETQKRGSPYLVGKGLAAALPPESASEGVRQAVDTPLVEDVDLNHLSNSAGREVRKMLRPFEDIWSGKVGTLVVTQHLITLKEGDKTVHSQPYRA